MLTYIILGTTFAFAAAVQPGPYQAYLLSQTLTNGWRRTLPAALAPLVSDGPIALFALLALSLTPRSFLSVLQCAGGLFLLYLAILAGRTWRHYGQSPISQPQSSQQSLLKAATVNLLNPNPYISWGTVMGPLFLKGWHERPEHGLLLLISFYGTMIVTNGGIIVLFSSVRNFGKRINRIMVGISAIALGCFAFYEFWLGIRSVASVWLH
jgi:threonine/homoserine/homoserine lactone efflux protein